MKQAKSSDGLNGQIIDEASEWFVEFNTGEVDPAARRCFDSWLRKSPEHLRAYLEMFPLWEDTARIDSGRTLNTDELIQLAKGPGQVVPLSSADPRRMHEFMTRRPRFAVAASVLCVCTALVAVGFYRIYYRSTYATDVGEQRVVVLDDGSTVELNSRSRVRVRFTKTAREIDLLEGEALFRVEKDEKRPFVVRSGSTDVRALGTQFDVYKKKGGTTVTVLEGRVAVVPLAPESKSSSADSTAALTLASATLVSAGEQVIATPATVSHASGADIAAATAWQQHRFIFSATPLPAVAEEFNRYNEHQLIVRDAQLTNFLVNGIFSSTEPSSLIRFLRAQPDLIVQDNGSEIIVTKR